MKSKLCFLFVIICNKSKNIRNYLYVLKILCIIGNYLECMFGCWFLKNNKKIDLSWDCIWLGVKKVLCNNLCLFVMFYEFFVLF